MKSYIFIYIISLLLLLPQAMLGQTYSKYESKGWCHLLLKGGMIRTHGDDGRRTGDHYMILHPGGSVLSMDFVNGFTVGPDFSLGKVLKNDSRLELGLMTEWACSRRALMYDFSLRYYLKPEYNTWFEIFISDRTRDFDDNPLMDREQQQLASGLFGWNGFKLYEASTYGLKGATNLLNDLRVEAGFWQEYRYGVRNYRRNNIFGIRPKSNNPRVRGIGLLDYEGTYDDLYRADLSLIYKPNSRLYIYDDMHSEWKNQGPVFRLDAKMGWGEEHSHYYDNWYQYSYGNSVYAIDQEKNEIRSLSLDLNVYQHIGAKTDKHQFQYFVSTGFFPIRKIVELQDMHHFNASHFGWQNRMESSLTWFSLLTNYELSTPRQWAEVHGEYMRRTNSVFAQYLQLHCAMVKHYRPHTELSYGWQLSKQIRIGLSAGMDGSQFDGLGFNLIIQDE